MGVNAFEIERKHRAISAPSRVTVGTTALSILADNINRKSMIVVNAGTTVIKLNLGTVDPTQTLYHIPLRAGTALDDGTGAIYLDEQWTGEVRAISSGAGGIVLVAEII